MNQLVSYFRQSKLAVTAFYFWHSFYKHFHLNVFTFTKNLWWFINDLVEYSHLPKNENNTLSLKSLIPMLADKTSDHPLEPYYYFQDSWACGKVFSYKPKHHHDVASSASTVAILSQFVPTTSIDIRRIDLRLPNLSFKKGDITKLPFKDNTIESFSSLCVVEHIGLGRYGDTLDQWGTEKSFSEMQRVLKKKGHLLVSVPVDKENKVFFNAHRAFTRSYILQMCDKLKLKEERYIYGRSMYKKYQPKKGYGVGLFHFQK
jgi:hypothetical protein